MSEKTTHKVTVQVTAHDGTVETFSGDTAIVFTIENGMECLRGKVKQINSNVAFVGHDIPEPIFAEVIGSLVGGFIKKRSENTPLLAAVELQHVAEIMEEYSKKIMDSASQESKEVALNAAIDNLIKTILS